MEPESRGPEALQPAAAVLADELLAIRCQLGEAAAFDALAARWHGPIWRYVRRLLDSDEAAADCAQDVWVRVFRGISRLREAARLRAWLFGIARRAVMDRLRDKYSAPAHVPEDVSDLPDIEDPRGVLPHDDDVGLMREELEQLPWAEREAIVLFYLQELTLAELATVLGVPVGTVKSRLFRARRLLHARLIERGIRP